MRIDSKWGAYKYNELIPFKPSTVLFCSLDSDFSMHPLSQSVAIRSERSPISSLSDRARLSLDLNHLISTVHSICESQKASYKRFEFASESGLESTELAGDGTDRPLLSKASRGNRREKGWATKLIALFSAIRRCRLRTPASSTRSVAFDEGLRPCKTSARVPTIRGQPDIGSASSPGAVGIDEAVFIKIKKTNRLVNPYSSGEEAEPISSWSRMVGTLAEVLEGRRPSSKATDLVEEAGVGNLHQRIAEKSVISFVAQPFSLLLPRDAFERSGRSVPSPASSVDSSPNSEANSNLLYGAFRLS
ncbi:hypothetical protein ACLOJK_008953 [Asimina triloba]